MGPPEHPNLRDWREEDADAFVALHADLDVGYWLGGPWSERASRERFEQARRPRDDGLGPWPIVDEAGGLVGVGGLARVGEHRPLHPAVEAAWRLLPRARGRGLATSTMGPILQRGFEVAGLDEIVAFTARSNVRSQALMRRLGFRATPERDFNHPTLAADHPLRPHVTYALPRGAAPC